MSDACILSVKPIITYPREAQIGKTYLMTIDLQPEEGFEWQYEEEEYPIYCAIDSDLFSSKPIDEPVIVLHRFGGSYGEIKFLLSATHRMDEGNLKISLINKWGVPVQTLYLNQIKLLSPESVQKEPDLAISKKVSEFQNNYSEAYRQEFRAAISYTLYLNDFDQGRLEQARRLRRDFWEKLRGLVENQAIAIGVVDIDFAAVGGDLDGAGRRISDRCQVGDRTLQIGNLQAKTHAALG